MKAIRYKSGRSSVAAGFGLTLLLLALGAIGCNARSTGIQVIPLSNRNVLDLNSDDVVRIMRRAGFSDRQILEYGPELRNGLAESGAVQIKIQNTVEAVFAANLDQGPCVYIVTRLRGSFIYNVETGWVTGP